MDTPDDMPKISKEQIAKARARYEAGVSLPTIAKDLKCHVTAIRYHANKDKWKKWANSAGQTLPSKEILPLEKRGIPSVASARPLDEIGKEVRSKLASNIQTTLERVSTLSPEDMREEVQLETVLGSLTKRAATVFGWAETQSNVLVSVGLLGALPDRETDVTPPREERAD